MKLFELQTENDCVIYNQNQVIISWFLYSDYMKEWFPVSRIAMRDHSPEKYKKMEDKIFAIEQHKEFAGDVDFEIQQMKDEKLGGLND